MALKILRISLWILLSCSITFESARALADVQQLRDTLSQEETTKDELQQLFFRILDEPKVFVDELFQLWDLSKENGPPLLRVRVAWLIGRVINDNMGIARAKELPEILEQAIELIQQHNLRFDRAELEFYSLEYIVSRDQNRFFEIKDQLLSKALQIKDEKNRAYAFSRLAFYYVDRAVNTPQLAKLIQDIRSLLGDPKEPSYDERDLDIYNTLSMILRGIEQEGEADRIDQYLSEACQKKKMRVFCSIRAYVVGFSLTFSEVESEKIRALTYMEKALELAQDAKDTLVISQAQYGLNMAYNSLKRSDEAIIFGKLAVAGFTNINQKDWAASAQKNLSQSYLIGGKLDLALTTIESALASCPEDFKNDRMRIYKQLSIIHEARGELSKSLEAYKQYVEIQSLLQTEDTKKQYIVLRNETLTQQNAWQEEQIQLLEKFKSVSVVAILLALLVLVVLLLVWRQSGLIKTSRQRMMEVLDHLDLGIFMLDSKLKLKDGYSPYLLDLLGEDRKTMNSADILHIFERKSNLGSDQVEVVRQILTLCIGENEWNWAMNNGNLPLEIELMGKRLNIHWQALTNSQGLINRFLISLRDVTELREVQRQAQLASETTESLRQKLSEILAGNVRLIFDYLEEISQNWPSLTTDLESENQSNKVRSRLHTWKGVARSLGLKSMAQSLHSLESAILSSDQRSPAKGQSLQLLTTCRDEYEQIVGMMRGQLDFNKESFRSLHQFGILYVNEMTRSLKQDGIPEEGLYIRDQVQNWNSTALKSVHEMLLHALSNALDHGFRRPKKEGRQLQPATIHIDAYESKGQVQVCIVDNGVGIDWNELRKLALQNGFGELDQVGLKQVIFQDGFSTAKTLSETSGRGVGMHAIKKEIERIGGRCELESEVNQGTKVTFTFPSETVLDSLKEAS